MNEYSNQGRDPVVTDTNAYYSRMAKQPELTDDAIADQKCADILADAFYREELVAMAMSNTEPLEVRELAAEALYELGWKAGIREAADAMTAALARGGK